MRNFNKDEIQKYEKMTKNAFNKLNRFKGITSKIPKVRKSHLISAFLLSGLFYLGYRMYDYRRYQNNHYVDLFSWKQNLAAEIRREDLFEKVKNLSLEKNRQNATNKYEKRINDQINKMLQKIKQKCTHQEHEEENSQKSKPKSKFKRKQNQKLQKSNHNHRKQLVLSKDIKSKLNLGYFLKLHTKIYTSTLTSNGNYIKKTYIIPIMIFDTPFFVTKKQQVKTIYKKKKYSKIVQGKGKFDLSSQCKNINYWNVFTDSKEKQIKNQQKSSENTSQQIKKTPNEENVVLKTEKNTYKTHSAYNKRKQNKQLLFQCRNKIKLIESQLKTKLKDAIDRNWQNKGKNDDEDELNNFSTSSITTWEHIKEKEK